MNRLSRRLETLERKRGGSLCPIVIVKGQPIPEDVGDQLVYIVDTGVPRRENYMDVEI